MRGLSPVLLIAAIGGSQWGCGANAPPTPTPPAAVATASIRRADPPKPATHAQRLVTVSPTAYGAALTDRRGFALYRFTRDRKTNSACYGGCATSWPPYLVPRGLARRTVTTGRVATIRRADGRIQVTYAGHPLYYYVGDRRPRQVLCQGVTEFGGGWYVVGPSGRLIR
jgi:predicted lipoprotein with Yx(FWY)xxD motif